MNWLLGLALLGASCSSFAQDYNFPKDFLFGVSNAAEQVEDELKDPWIAFGEQGRIRAFQNQASPEKRIRFWTNPEREIDLAQSLGVDIFRLGLSWQRIMPSADSTPDSQALSRYFDILEQMRQRKMKVMLTLFHHALPDWAISMGGWTNPELVPIFVKYGKAAVDRLGDRVDYWSVFNEPNVFALFTYVAGIWPGDGASILAGLDIGFYRGDFFKALDNMAEAHRQIYDYIHQRHPKISKVGIAHNTANYKPGGLAGGLISDWAWKNMNWYFPDLLKDKMDFMGINYYGSEYMAVSGVLFSDEAEYNDAGRAIDPTGFHRIVSEYHQRYNLPVFITENGTADMDDKVRPAYITEHLVALNAAMKQGVPVLGYIYWTLSDNLEWSDGYCPKFGLVAVEREKDFNRVPRPSFGFFRRIIEENGFSQSTRDSVWAEYQQNWGQERKMCRAENGKDGLDIPRVTKLKAVDWRFK